MSGAPRQGRAVAASPGVARGVAQKIHRGEIPVPKRHVEPREVEREIERLETAIAASIADVDAERLHLLDLESQEPLHILDAQRLMLLDPDLSKKVRAMIERERINAEWALHQQIEGISAVFEKLEDDYLRARKADIEQVGLRIMRHLAGQNGHPSLREGDEPVILVSEYFTPLEIMRFWREGAAGCITAQGGPNTHSIIIARGLGLPALMGAEDALDLIEDGDPVILDGEQGLWIANPDEDTRAQYRRFSAAIHVVQDEMHIFAARPSVSADGHALRLMANLEVAEEVPLAREVGAEGVGLYRTEFLLTQTDRLPDEEEQFEHYARVVRGMEGMPVVFRLLDIGGEKPMLFEHVLGHDDWGANPALGLRGIRILLRRPEVLRTQLRALLRASREGQVRILIPMVTRTSEVAEVRRLLEECARELGLPPVPVGTMVEVPAAVMIAEELAGISDFFSVGTNDLIQYTLAVDRADEEVAELYEPAHPAVERTLRLIVAAARKQGIPVAMCGELAADTDWTEKLMNMGFDCLSMSVHHILPVRKHLSHLRWRPETPPA